MMKFIAFRIRMRRLVGFFGILLLVSGAALGQIIENPAKPVAKDAGRVLALTEVWRITDDSGEFYLKNPRELRIAEEGSILLHDSDQLLKFSPEGKFVRSLLKKGQGPGEISDLAFQFRTRMNDLYVYDLNGHRFWRADLEGTFQQSISVTGVDTSTLIAAASEGPVIAGIQPSFSWPTKSGATATALSVPHRIVLVPRNGGPARDIFKWERQLIRGLNATLWDPMVISADRDANTFYMALEWDYRISVLDAMTGKIIRKFSRPYPKFRILWTDKQKKMVREMGMPLTEFWPDISNLYPTSEGICVETSTDDKAKGRLIDVFDKDGRFVDSFYLGPGKTLMAVQEGVVFCQEKRPDDTIVIVKYHIRKTS